MSLTYLIRNPIVKFSHGEAHFVLSFQWVAVNSEIVRKKFSVNSIKRHICDVGNSRLGHDHLHQLTIE